MLPTLRRTSALVTEWSQNWGSLRRVKLLTNNGDLKRLASAVLHSELPVGDAIRVAPDDGAEIWRVVEIGIQSVKAEHDISQHTFLIGNSQGNNDSARRTRSVPPSSRAKSHALWPATWTPTPGVGS